MNGAAAVITTAVRAGVDTCFANPGTTEIHLVGALRESPSIRPILCLFEGVCTGAADGYARMAGRPALTLLHLGPGLANGVANLHNAQKAHTPVINLVGNHARRHLNNDSILASDIAGIARPVSVFVRQTTVVEDSARDFAAAHRAAVEHLGVATLILPADVQWSELKGDQASPTLRGSHRTYDSRDVATAAAALRAARPAALLLGGNALLERGLVAAGRIQAAVRCRVFCTRAPARIEAGPGIPIVERLGYFPEASAAQVAGVGCFVLAGTNNPAAIFAYGDGPTHVIPHDRHVVELARALDDATAALEALADELAAPAPVLTARRRPELPGGKLSSRNLADTLAAVQPDQAILVDEANTSAANLFEAAGAARVTYLGLTGGAIGIGSPLAIGAAVASPDRPVIAVQGDGSAMYTLQALWTQARERLHVTTVICANRSYRILDVERERAGIARLEGPAATLIDLTDPTIDWVKIAHGMGVEGSRAATPRELSEQLSASVAAEGPHLIEAVLET
ncbi:MAG: acetolactate synthase large subunit [Candidatus Dormibacteria bacterium]